MGIFGWGLGLFVLAVAVILLIASRKPDEFVVERRGIMPAPPEAVFAEINDLARWQAWSPWAKKDPNAKNTFSDHTAGVGASLRWEGNNQVGTGTMTISESRPAERVVMDLAFEKPFKARNKARFDLRPVSGGTELVWSMRGPAPLMSKVMDLLMNMDRMIGRDFEQGLANLKGRLDGTAG